MTIAYLDTCRIVFVDFYVRIYSCLLHTLTIAENIYHLGTRPKFVRLQGGSKDGDYNHRFLNENEPGQVYDHS